MGLGMQSRADHLLQGVGKPSHSRLPAMGAKKKCGVGFGLRRYARLLASGGDGSRTPAVGAGLCFEPTSGTGATIRIPVLLPLGKARCPVLA